MNLEDKAEEAPNVLLAGSLPESEYRFHTTELVGANDITDEGEFPEFGDFLECDERSPVDGTDRGTVYIEVPQKLAQWLVEHVEPGDWFTVNAAEKDENGTWQVDCETVDETSAQSLEAAAAMGNDDGS